MMLPFAQIQLGNPVTGLGQKQGGIFPQLPTGEGGESFDMLLGLLASSGCVPGDAGYGEEERESGVGNRESIIGTAAQAIMNALNGVAARGAGFVIPEAGAEPLVVLPEHTRNEQTFALPHTTLRLAKHAETPVGLPVAQPWIVTKLQYNVELTPGNYQVLKAKVADGVLNLEVVPKDKLAEPIKVSVPVEMLANEQTAGITRTIRPDLTTPIAPKRIAVESFAAPHAELETLLGSVNLRELQVTGTAQAPSAGVAKSPVALRLLGEQAGQRIVLTAQLDKSQLKVRAAEKSPVAAFIPDTKTNVPPAPVAASLQPAYDEAVLPVRQIRPVAVAFDNMTKTEDFQTIEQLFAASPNQAGEVSRFESLLGRGADVSVHHPLEPKFEQIPVRISLPIEPLPLKPEGKTIMLRIEPEHLGPARLHLTMRHDALSAKVTVETSQAKAAVDASLDQLTDQLHRAGVKVDYIEVNVRNGGADNQSFHRQAEWFRSERQPATRFADEEIVEVMPRAIPLARPAYIGATGVNLFA